jgi:hypothetical protein
MPIRIDTRGSRFAAILTTVVLAAVLITGNPWLLGFQTLVFAIGASCGPAASPYRLLCSWLLRPRLGPPAKTEDAVPLQFAQAVGLVFGLAGLLGYAADASGLVYVAISAAMVAAFLNAVFGLCLGCEIYLRYRPFVSSPHPITEVNS